MFYLKLSRLKNSHQFSSEQVNSVRMFLEKVPVYHRSRFTASYVRNDLQWETKQVHRLLSALVQEEILQVKYEVLCPECSLTVAVVDDVTKAKGFFWCSDCCCEIESDEQWVIFNFHQNFMGIGLPGINKSSLSLQDGDDDLNSFFSSTPVFASNQYYNLEQGEYKDHYNRIKNALTNDEKKHAMEDLAEYVAGSIKGFVPSGKDSRTTTGEIDRTFRNDANYHPILSQLGPFIQIECKHVAKPVNPGEIGDFTRHMDFIGAKTGLYFTMKGVTGNSNRDGWLAILQEWRNHQRAILVFNPSHYDRIDKGESFLIIFFEEYQKVTMQLPKEHVFPAGVRVT